jgi:hypothetical protein
MRIGSGTLRFLWVVFLVGWPVGLPLMAQEEKPEVIAHAVGCPQGCAPCEAVIRKALERIALDGDWSHGVIGLVFLAGGSTLEEGPYQEQLKQGLAFFKSEQGRTFGGYSRLPERGAGFQLSARTLFLSELLVRHPERKDLRELVQEFVGYIKERADNPITETVGILRRGDSGPAAATVLGLLALSVARRAGVEVSEETVETLRGCMHRAQYRIGAISYGILPKKLEGKGAPFHEGMEEETHCRTYLAWLVADQMGWKEDMLWTMTAEWLKEHGSPEQAAFQEGHGHTLISAGAAGWMLYRQGGREAWDRFWARFRDRMREMQRSDGHIAPESWSPNRSWDTAWCLLVALTPQETLTVTRR